MDEPNEYPTENSEQHYVHSVLRERIVEHVFVGDVLRRLWQRGVTDLELLRSEYDAGGYDRSQGIATSLSTKVLLE
ncbi:hypothetical protein [Pararobbsia alpina]|uniref:Uncharacterized protein n=1 Tax=Pararobbsia alpina TaxID=621374 RepID=A0A6S7C0J9_9BURK|nr:hypothetical protein [Pararobbsia alpina]CAB3805334.1 hypothetical protein LMG28138_05650 [Pararobbsia alpina]